MLLVHTKPNLMYYHSGMSEIRVYLRYIEYEISRVDCIIKLKLKYTLIHLI